RGDLRRRRGRDPGHGPGSGPLPHRLRLALMVRRRSLLAYLIGAGVAGTFLIGPYGLRLAVISLLPGAAIGSMPFFLLPIVWGLWNLLRVHRAPGIGIGAWGALLGFGLGVVVNLLFLVEGTWFRAAPFLPPFLALLYFLLFRLIVGPLNEALGVEEHRGDG